MSGKLVDIFVRLLKDSRSAGMSCTFFWSCRLPEVLDYLVPYETALFHMRLLCPTHIKDMFHKSSSFFHETFSSVPHKNLPSHMWLLIPHQTAVPHEIAIFHKWLLCPIQDCSVPHKTALSHMRPLCLSWHCPVPNVTLLFFTRLLLPTWDLFVQDKTDFLIWDCFVPH